MKFYVYWEHGDARHGDFQADLEEHDTEDAARASVEDLKQTCYGMVGFTVRIFQGDELEQT